MEPLLNLVQVQTHALAGGGDSGPGAAGAGVIVLKIFISTLNLGKYFKPHLLRLARLVPEVADVDQRGGHQTSGQQGLSYRE